MDINILDGIFNCLACPECYEVETLHLNDTNTKKKGPAVERLPVAMMEDNN